MRIYVIGVIVVLLIVATYYIIKPNEKTSVTVDTKPSSVEPQATQEETALPVIQDSVLEPPVQNQNEVIDELPPWVKPEPEVVPEIEPELKTVAEPLPALGESDASIREELARLLSPMRFTDMFKPDAIISRFVVIVDNIPAKKLPQKYLFTQPLKTTFTVMKDINDDEFVHPSNFDRYEKFVKLAEIINLNTLASLYMRYYPLFQEAYENLGYPDMHFNDRLLYVIEHLLATPTTENPIKLIRPHVFYHFANPDLEALSAGQKTLLRMGKDNAAKIKPRLRKMRQLLSNLKIADLTSTE